MFITKSVTLNNGVQAEFFRIHRIIIDLDGEYMQISLKLYLDQASYEGQASAIADEKIEFNGVDNPFDINVSENIFSTAYSKLLTQTKVPFAGIEIDFTTAVFS